MLRRVVGLLAVTLVLTPVLPAAEARLQEGDFVAIIGDSITEQKLYSAFMEEYLLMCRPAASLRAMQFGWGGETSWGFKGRLANDVLGFKPTLVTTCYGMNDGGYRPFDPNSQGKNYRDSQRQIAQAFKKAGVRLIVVGSPGCVDADTFGNSPERAKMYNETLAKLRDIAREVAKEEGVVFANVYDAMMEAMTKAKAKHGNKYHLAGGDGVHPAQNGQLVMAYAFLKALGCDGDLGCITIDLASGKATAAGGHKVLSAEGGTAQIESTRYPFCFLGDKNPASPGSARGVLEFVPFNQDLNRLRLVVQGAKGGRLKVTWGKESKEFDAAALAEGVNLAAEFLDNPFCDAFEKASRAIREQQNYETPMVKDLVNRIPHFVRMLPDQAEAFDRIRQAASRRDKELFDAAAGAVVPVKHTIKVEPAAGAAPKAE